MSETSEVLVVPHLSLLEGDVPILRVQTVAPPNIDPSIIDDETLAALGPDDYVKSEVVNRTTVVDLHPAPLCNRLHKQVIPSQSFVNAMAKVLSLPHDPAVDRVLGIRLTPGATNNATISVYPTAQCTFSPKQAAKAADGFRSTIAALPYGTVGNLLELDLTETKQAELVRRSSRGGPGVEWATVFWKRLQSLGPDTRQPRATSSNFSIALRASDPKLYDAQTSLKGAEALLQACVGLGWVATEAAKNKNATNNLIPKFGWSNSRRSPDLHMLSVVRTIL
jgi:hypothetical protein